MELRLDRTFYSIHSTIGVLYVDDVIECLTLEDVARAEGVKIPNETCIPPGRYRIVVNWSPKHKCSMPYLVDVPGFSFIMIHQGNYPENTSGCLLVGTEKAPDKVLHSDDAFNKLIPKLKAAQDAGEQIWITVRNIPNVPP
jgi:hypothetical protein